MDAIYLLLAIVYVATILIQLTFIVKSHYEAGFTGNEKIWIKIGYGVVYIIMLILAPAVLCLQIGCILYNKIMED